MRGHLLSHAIVLLSVFPVWANAQAPAWPEPEIVLEVEGRPARADYLGMGLLALPDANGDGYVDFAVSSAGRRQTLIYFGGPGILDSVEDAVLEGGGPLVGADFNGDGLMDIAVQRPGRLIDSLTGEGLGSEIPDSVYIYLAKWRTGCIYGGDPDLRLGVHEHWARASQFGVDMGTGDFNGDWYQDLVTSAPVYHGREVDSCRSGKVIVYLGSATAPLREKFEIVPTAGCDIRLGVGVTLADVNADGIEDVIAGVLKREDTTPQSERSSKQIYLGKRGITQTQIVPWQCVEGELIEEGNTWFAYMPVLDVNGDGAADILWPKDHGAGILLGSAAGYRKSDTLVIHNPDGEAMRWFGGEIHNIVDWNADGYSDYAISFYGYASRWVGIYAGGSIGIKDTIIARTVKTRDLEWYGRYLISGDFNGDGLNDYCSSKCADYEFDRYPIQRGWFHIVSGNPELAVGIEETPDLDGDFKIFPNPTTDELHIVPGDVDSGTQCIDIMDRQGAVICSMHADRMHTDSGTYTIGLKSLVNASGVYFVRIRTGGSEILKKVVYLQ